MVSCMCLAILQNTSFFVNAEENITKKEGYLSYEIINNEVKITGCDVQASGDFYIPNKISGYPVTAIGPEAFYIVDDYGRITPTNIVNLYIPETVVDIDREAFAACGIRGIVVDKNNEVFASSNGILFNKSMTTLIKCPSGFSETKYTIPDSVEKIEQSAFHLANLKEVVISDSVNTIESFAFLYCNSLETLYIGKGLKTVGYGAFASCDNLKSVVFSDGAETIGENMFRDCQNLSSVVIGNTVTTIGKEAFANCKRLTHITLPDSVETIDENAFTGSRIWHIFYAGTETKWKQIKQPKISCVVHFDSSKSEIESSETGDTDENKKVKEKCLICSDERAFFIDPPTIGFINMKEHEDLDFDCITFDYHSIDEWNVIKEATCTESGIGEGICSYYGCSKTGEVEIPILEHDYQIVNIEREATSKLYGIRTVKCSVCGNQTRETYDFEEDNDAINTDTKEVKEKSTIGFVIGCSVLGIAALSAVAIFLIRNKKKHI